MSTATEMLDLYLDAEKKILQGQTVIHNGKHLTRADLGQVIKERKVWERRVQAERNLGRGYSLASFE